MKLLITGIVICIIIIMSLIILNRNIYFSEDFANKESSYNQNTIEDLIELSYLPFNPYEKDEQTEYDVIDLYKKILDRLPTSLEIKYGILTSKLKLIEDLYNSPEYDKLFKVQNNDANGNIEGSIAKRNLIKRLSDLYKKTYSKDVPDRMVMPLRDCYIHLRCNYYLFMAMIQSKTYPNFENDVLTTTVITKKNLLEKFDKYFNLLELKLLAEDKAKVNKTSSDIKYSNIEDEFKKYYNAIPMNVNKEISGKINLNELKSYLTDTQKEGLNVTECYQNSNNDNNAQLSTREPEKKCSTQSKELNDFKKLINAREPEKLKDDVIKKIPKNSEVYVRIYDPINYKQTYKGSLEDTKNLYRPPVCTSLGQAQLTKPIFTESKLLFQGTDIERAFEETQVGSIMPKFTYREYQDVRIQ